MRPFYLNFPKLLALVLCCTFFVSNSAQSIYDYEIKNVVVVDVSKGKLSKPCNVYILGENIDLITKSQELLPAKQSLDGTGQFLIPGLWDMHTHNWWNIHFSDWYVKYGVTGVRNMYTPMPLIQALEDSMSRGEVTGPVYYAAGRVLEGKKPDFPDWIVIDTKEKIGPALDSLQAEGSDFVKVYNKIPRDVYFELMKEAKRRGLRVEGHLPMMVTAIEASNAGQRSFEHLLGIPDLCTHQQLFANKHEFNWFAALMREDDYGKLMIDERTAKRAFSVLRKNNTHICPTLTVLYNYLHPDTLFEKDDAFKNLPEEVAQYWSSSIARFRERDESYKNMSAKKYETFKKVTKLLYDSKVPLLVGTDAMNPYCYPGLSVHRELELMKECGIPDAALLKMATLDAANFIGFTQYGEVKKGKKASIVLLGANPLNDISNSKRINAVFVNGKRVQLTY